MGDKGEEGNKKYISETKTQRPDVTSGMTATSLHQPALNSPNSVDAGKACTETTLATQHG